MTAGRALAFLLAGCAVGFVGCRGQRDAGTPAATESTAEATAGPAVGRLPATPADERPLVVFLGDSLTAGLGLAEDEAFPALVQQRLREERPIRVVNAGVSGDTTSGGLTRLDWLLRQRPDLLVVELGANDALRGKPVAEIEANLREIVRRIRAAGVPVLLVGLRIPPSYGADYAEAFEAVYPRVAADLDVPLVPFLLEGVAAEPELNQPDGIHPNARGQEIVAQTMAPWVERALANPR